MSIVMSALPLPFKIRVIPSAVPRGTTAALEIAISEGVQLRTDVTEAALPWGKATRLPFDVSVVAAKLNETAATPLGMPHDPPIGKLRPTPPDSPGGPNGPLKPLPRVSATRQGASAWNASELEETAAASGRRPPVAAPPS